ncbi:PucR family transcriptional regulator [Streptomyces sp. 3MP-14]|uniref:PucR family transcriptional regulator n=1 Tax=Streptomyces mimosae TaxID=2586635 RepID=A0A5N6AAM3_9ACTN|nr:MULTISPECIES: helix-turn-helix domain-containing protein [Streptomyces]KAB8165877.1 PucR family transcriptional regulator [Streptomyces mimosae]KAB8176266.1 PucR family transcriptional regulator [Streptomyces sp. 3MP-14]
MRSAHRELQELIDEVCALLDAPATLEGRDFRLIAFGAHDSEDEGALDPVRTRSILRRGSTAAVRTWFEGFGITTARAPVRIPPEPSAGVRTGRLCLPVRHGGVVHGYIWLLDDGALALDDPRLTEAMAVARRAGALLAEEARVGARLGELLRALLAGHGEEGVAAGAELAEELGPVAEGPLALLAIAPWEVAHELPASPPGALALTALPGQRAGAAWALAALVRPAAARAVARRLGAGVGAGAGAGAGAERGAHAGVSAPRHAVAELPAAWPEALGAARAAGASDRFGPLAAWAEIGPYRLLSALPPRLPPDPAVLPLLRPEHRELAHTAEAFLDHAGQATRTAESLGIHRQTLYYRISRIEQLTGLDLNDGEDRLLLHLALKTAGW